VIGYSALMSLFIGSFGAIAASSFKEFLAYSSLGQLGFLMLGLASGNFKTAVSSLFFLIYYVVSMVIILLILSFYTKEDGSLIYSFNDLRFLSKKPLQAFFFSVAIINMSGIPPLPGFFSKFFILHSLVSGGNFIYTGVALFLSLVTMFYYIRVILLV
jgi:NADH-quinone oxidoreductase subunit N